MRMIANRPVAVAAAFSKSWRPMSPGERLAAAIPEPTTTAARKAEPRNSAKSRRGSGGDTSGGDQIGDQRVHTRRDLVADPANGLEVLSGRILELPVLISLAGID